jgi:uncharacterized RDD family membrane protein YckC
VTSPAAVAEPATGPGAGEARPAGRPASLWRRFAASQIDASLVFVLCLVAVIAVVATVVWAADLGGTPERTVLAIALAASLFGWVALSGAYHIAFVGALGQTPGHRAMGIRVVQVGGGSLGYGRAALRWAGILVATLTLGLGYLPIVLTRTRRGLHDFLAGAVVVEA